MEIRQRSATPRRLGLIGLAIAAAVSLACCATANAGTYIMNSCDVPGTPPGPVAPWVWEAGANVSPMDACAQGAGFGFYFAGTMAMPWGGTSALALNLSDSEHISIRQVRLWLVGRFAGTGSAIFVGTNAGAPDGQVTNSDIMGPPGGDTLSSPHVTSVLPFGTRVIRVLLGCVGGTSSDCYPASRSVLDVIGAQTTLIESVPPSISVDGGTLVAADEASSTPTLRYSARDDQSGVETVEVLIDDRVALKRSAECPHAGLAACPRARSEEVSLDTSHLSTGSHSLRMRATDAAGNSVDTPARVMEVGDAPSPASTAPLPRGAGGRLSASFASASKRSLTVSYSGRPKVRGRLTDESGAPIASAPVALVESIAGRPSSVVPVARTGVDGRYAFRLRSRGQTRSARVQVEVAGENDPIQSPTLRLKVRAAASLRIALRGVRVRYSGRVLSQGIPRRGVVVIMQGRRRGGVWQAFANRRIPRTGRFTGTYRLRVRRPGVALQFRAVIPAARSYPYAAGTSPVVTRLVR